MLNIGEINTLNILRRTSVGMYLSDDANEYEILLPNKYILPEFEVGETADVFIYKDSEERLIATTLTPYIFLNTFAYLQVKQINAIGAFLDWGLEKDLFVPFKEQAIKMLEGKYYIVYAYLDKGTDRITASSKLEKFIDKGKPNLNIHDEVDLLIYKYTDLGVSAIINHQYEGLIYHNEIFKELAPGDSCTGYIKFIRPDFKIDLALQKSGAEHRESSAQFILLYLKSHKGFLALTDKSDPQEIIEKLDMSKKTFKKAIGSLYKSRLIRIEEDGIYLL